MWLEEALKRPRRLAAVHGGEVTEPRLSATGYPFDLGP